MGRFAESQKGTLQTGEVTVDRRTRLRYHDKCHGCLENRVQLREVVGAGLAAEGDGRDHVSGLHEGLAEGARHRGVQIVFAYVDRGDDDVAAPGVGLAVGDETPRAAPQAHISFKGQTAEGLAGDDNAHTCLFHHFTERRECVAGMIKAKVDCAAESVYNLSDERGSVSFNDFEWQLVRHE